MELGFKGFWLRKKKMNAAAAAAAASEAHNGGAYESDSESNSDDSSEYYQPISTADGEDDEETNASDRLPNGWVENGLSSLDLTDEEEEEEDEEEEATESESAIESAFREDERRRSAPLTEENAVRVMDAMRGISFGGGGGGGAAAPDWAGQVSDDQWIDRLMRLRRPSSSSSAATDP